MENSILKRRLVKGASRTFAALLLLGGTMGFSSCKDDLLTGTPEWLGSSIYEELEERGQFTQTLALINDPELADAHYPELLRLTGSMTVFVADDAAWQRYLSKRGLTSVSQLSKAEKKTLLKASMINSAYLIELLDNENNGSTEPFEGRTMRRDSRMELDDSITILSRDDMPAVNPYRVDNNGAVIDYWSDVRDKANIKIYQDATVAPMVHFLPGFMSQTGITNEDLAVISNGASQSVNRSYINGHPISLNKGVWSKDAGKTYLQDITCQNGYIHILDEVPEPLPNMAEIIRQKPQFSIFSELLERFSYPQIYNTITLEDGTREVYYTKRYFNASLNHGLEQYTKENGTVVPVNNRLGVASSSKGFDPGWNQYALYTEPSTPMGRDAAAMFVPTNEWMESYLHNDGSAIGAKYEYDWSKVPDNLVVSFLDNCMQTSFRSTIPTKFAGVKNTASDNMGITMDDVDSCFLACNGAVYEVTNVFAAPKHQSVGFPASLFADETDENKKLSIASRIQDYEPPMYNPGTTTEHPYHKAWRVNEFNAYLSSMSSTYSYLLAIDNAYGYYIDPYSIVEKKPAAFRFYLPTGNSDLPMRAEAFYLDENMQVTDAHAAAPSLTVVANRLYDLMDNSIIVHGQRPSTPIHPGQDVYLTKAGGAIKVQFSGNTVTGIAGSYQAEKGEYIAVTPELTFDMTEKGNGVTYILGALPQSTLTSPYQLMTNVEAHPEYSSFASLLKEASFVETKEEMDGHPTIGNPITLFGNYHYTVYIPVNSEIDDLITAGKLPSADQRKEWETFKTALSDYVTKELDLLPEAEKEARSIEIDLLEAEADDRLQTMQDVIDNFLRYHFQDGSLFIGGVDTVGVFETSSIDLDMNRFRRLNVTVNHNSGTYRIQGHESGVIANVIDDDVNSNQMSRQYLFTKSDRTIFSSSYVVTHLIDKALYYDASQFLPAGFPSPVYPEWLPIPTEPEPEPESGSGPSPIRKKHPSQMIPLKYYNR